MAPRNSGVMENADLTGYAGTPGCGTFLNPGGKGKGGKGGHISFSYR